MNDHPIKISYLSYFYYQFNFDPYARPSTRTKYFFVHSNIEIVQDKNFV